MAKVSIIVPIYNVEKYLDKCVESILAQTYTDFELILVDDGSPDNCPQMCDEWTKKDNRIKVIHKPNGGLSSARNAGIDICQGDYILFCDSDDYVSETWCESFINLANEDQPNLIFGGTNVDYVSADKTLIETKIKGNDNGVEKYTIEHFLDFHIDGLAGYAWNCLYSSDIIKNKNIRFRTDVIIEDLPFNLEYLQYVDNITYSGYCGYHYVQRPRETLSVKYYVNGFLKYQEKYAFIQQFIDKCISADLRDKYRIKIANNYLYYFLDALNNTFDKRNDASVLEKIKFNIKTIKTDEFQHCIRYANSHNENPRYINLLKKDHYITALLYSVATKIKNCKIFNRGIK